MQFLLCDLYEGSRSINLSVVFVHQLYLICIDCTTFDIVERWSVEDDVWVYYELIVLSFNDELWKKESGVGPMKERIANDEREHLSLSCLRIVALVSCWQVFTSAR